MFKITKHCKSVTDDDKDKTVCKKPLLLNEKFRLLDDDGNIYFYGYSDDSSDFDPLDYYGTSYGCTAIQYKNDKTGLYEFL